MKRKNFFQKIGIFPLYYFCLKAQKCHDFDCKFSPFLNSQLKGDSTTENVSDVRNPADKCSKGSTQAESDVRNPADKCSKGSTQAARAIEKNIVDLVDLVAKMEKTDGEKTKPKVDLCSQQNRNAKLD